MKWIRFFFLLFLVPNLVFAFAREDASEIIGKINYELNRRNELIGHFNDQAPNEKEQGLDLLREAIACCNRAIHYCNKILKEVDDKSQKKRHSEPWASIKRDCEQTKGSINSSIADLQNTIDQVLQNCAHTRAFENAVSLYQERLQKAELANTRLQNYPRRLDNVEEVVSTLGEVATLHEEVASSAHEVLNFLAAYSDATSEANRNHLNQTIQFHKQAADTHRKEAAAWPEVVHGQKESLASCPETIKGGKDRLTENVSSLSPEEFVKREQQRRELFYKPNLLEPDRFFQSLLYKIRRPCAIPLDGQTEKSEKNFTLYTEQFYRFLVQSNTPISELLVKVYDRGDVVHEEKIDLPFNNGPRWERYLTADGMLFVPETKLKTAFGIDLRMERVYDSNCSFSLIIAQRGIHSECAFSVSADKSGVLYACDFSEPPPWQLGALRKPALPNADRPTSGRLEGVAKVHMYPDSLALTEPVSYPLLDRLVEELKGDPLALTAYVYNEIALADPYLHQELGIFRAPPINRSASMTYLAKEGSPWEQCQLLVYLLRKAGYPALYVDGAFSVLPKAFVEKMLFTRLPENQTEAVLQYPSVLLFDGDKEISLFPWMKEIQIHEGFDVYHFMPEEYASADRWLLRYLQGDERILKHIGSDGDDTAGILFVRFVEEELRCQGLCLSDVGIHRTHLKEQFTAWEDFPRPTSIVGLPRSLYSLKAKPELFSGATVSIASHENPEKKRTFTLSFAELNGSPVLLQFLKNGCDLRIECDGLPGQALELDATDHTVDITVSGSFVASTNQTFSIAKGTCAALCFHFGGASPEITSHFYEQFSREKQMDQRLQALLSFVGAAYFEKCGRAAKILADLHKVNPNINFACGLAKLSPDLTSGSFQTEADLRLPQVDMHWQGGQQSFPFLPIAWHQEIHSATRQFLALVLADGSSNEHQILREVFQDPYAVSTVRLLQLSHLEQQKKGWPEVGFLVFTPSIFEAADKTPEAAQHLYFSHLKDLGLRNLKAASSGQWDVIKELLDPEKHPWSYAYMTPGSIFSQNGAYQEMGSLILSPTLLCALISNNHLLSRGGLGSPLPSEYLTRDAIRDWQLVPSDGGRTLQLPSQIAPSPVATRGIQTPDVRLEHKPNLNSVADPVDTVTGAFYIDDVDLVLPGPFPLEIRRNYNNQNPLPGNFGCGWKLSLNPILIKQDDKLYAAETDGTVIAYSFNQATSRWEVLPENNPDLCNLGKSGNPFHFYIENDILYGSDGSKRYFEADRLTRWVNAKGNTLTFIYDGDRLSRIESSNGDYCGVHYSPEGLISEIYAKDGRRISYNYSLQGDLIRVVLPNTAVISYEYDKSHRIIRETRPLGKILENIYDQQGRVIEQRSPMGQQQEMVSTAFFAYNDGTTTVTDAGGGTTTYNIFQKQIYKITDPLGNQIFQSWFIDEKSWFDPQTECVLVWEGLGGAPKCLKASTDKRGLTTSWLYDSRGNPIEIWLKGDDLTGSGDSSILKKLTYNAQDLCTQEEVLDQKIITTYDPTFPWLPKRVEKYSGNTLLSYADVEYNSLGQVEKEDHSGTIVLWQYDARGFPSQKTQKTGTEDPDVITTYSYSAQGQCIRTTSADSIEENRYDIMGNALESLVHSPSGALLSATYIGYNLNNEPVWKQTANSENVIYFDYHASGLIKATRQNLFPSRSVAYTLYEYDPRGYLTQEVDPLGYCTYRTYDTLGKVTCETREGHSTHFSYEPGGFVETIASPSGAQTTRLYTTNGLLKEEIYPDGTKRSFIYDFFGRSVQETKNGISWAIQYDDARHQVIRTHLETKATEISEFDSKGNLVRFTDAAGQPAEKTYDGLNRIKTETTPTGEQTTWNYQGDTVVCTLPSGEKRVQRYEGGRLVESDVVSAAGNLIASSSYHYDPENDVQTIVQGEEVTTTWMNAQNLPIRVEQGKIITTYEYDSCGNCTAVIDGDGRVTLQTFDGLGRLVQKELPDGGLVQYAYDPDSHLSQCHLPNGATWTASYDSMGRKCSEELQAKGQTSQRWDYAYENGYLKETKDPLQRSHTYLYDPHGRLAQENVDGWQRIYTYDPRGLLSSAEQISPSEHSRVNRSYDPSCRLVLETITLNSQIIQHTEQTWGPSHRSLQIEGHQRDFIYQHGRLTQVSIPHLDLSYTYNLSGSLQTKSTPLSQTTTAYNTSGLPENIRTTLPDGSYDETLHWYSSGKLLAYSFPQLQKQFTYTKRGALQSAGAEKYEFDFGSPGTGVRTAAPDSFVSQDGLDPFGKILTEISDKNPISTAYDPMGQVITQNQRQFEWDPWGRLLQVTDPAYTWEASYDALGRRLQTRFTQSTTHITTSLYDPEEEFQEIGVKYGDRTFWKIFGPSTCDALTDETEATLILTHNALGQLAGVISPQGTLHSEQFPSSYGLQANTSFPSNLLTYAQSLTWHSKCQDPTGLIWMGARYYDPQGGRFLSPDPIGYPICLNLYTYAGGDPINYLDPDGRFHSPVYQTTGPSRIDHSRALVGFPNSLVGGNNVFSSTSNHSLKATKTSISAVKVPLTFYGNFPRTRTPEGKSIFGHGWIGGRDINHVEFTQGAYPGPKIYTDENKTSLCKDTVSLTLWMSPKQQKSAIKAGNYNRWSIRDNCIDHVEKSLDAIGYPHPHFKPSSIGHSNPTIYCKWILEEKKHIDPRFLPDAVNDAEN